MPFPTRDIAETTRARVRGSLFDESFEGVDKVDDILDFERYINAGRGQGIVCRASKGIRFVIEWRNGGV